MLRFRCGKHLLSRAPYSPPQQAEEEKEETPPMPDRGGRKTGGEETGQDMTGRDGPCPAPPRTRFRPRPGPVPSGDGAPRSSPHPSRSRGRHFVAVPPRGRGSVERRLWPGELLRGSSAPRQPFLPWLCTPPCCFEACVCGPACTHSRLGPWVCQCGGPKPVLQLSELVRRALGSFPAVFGNLKRQSTYCYRRAADRPVEGSSELYNNGKWGLAMTHHKEMPSCEHFVTSGPPVYLTGAHLKYTSGKLCEKQIA